MFLNLAFLLEEDVLDFLSRKLEEPIVSRPPKPLALGHIRVSICCLITNRTIGVTDPAPTQPRK